MILIERRSHDLSRMLFVGLDAKRKGLDTAIETVRILHARGLRIVLNVVGHRDFLPQADVPPYVQLEGILPREGERMRELFEASSLFILPTRLFPHQPMRGGGLRAAGGLAANRRRPEHHRE
jgi:hypothetical protein